MVYEATVGKHADYRDIFELRGRLYHEAMARFPAARTEEFESIIREAAISDDMTVVDVPSGGAYLSNHLNSVELVGLETSHTFASLATSRTEKVVLYDNRRFPLKDNCADRVLSIAGLHHVEDKRAIFSEMNRVLTGEGLAVVADVAEDSFVQHFLDDFVGRYCETGHSGWYFGETTRGELRLAEFEILKDSLLNYAWYAPDELQLAEFCRLLFGMTRTTKERVLEGMQEYLGIGPHEKGVCCSWQLRCMVCGKERY